MKIVINRCYGGFGLSHKGMTRYLELKRITVYPELSDIWESWEFYTYWLVPPEQRIEFPSADDKDQVSKEDYFALVELFNSQSLDDRSIERNDPALVQVVLEMGEECYGYSAELNVVDIPDDVEWDIEEYDGIEWVAEKHRVWM